MGDNSTIQWTDATWNPTRGCSKDGPECDNCYAMAVAHRFSGPGKPYHGLTRVIGGRGQWNGAVRPIPQMFDQPLHWKRGRRIFVDSMSDLFHESLLDHIIDDIFAVMTQARQHTYQVLTKRAERMRAYMTRPGLDEAWGQAINALHHRRGPITSGCFYSFPVPHIQLGVSIGTVKAKLEKLPHLQQTPAAVRFLSCEPLLEDLGTIDLTGIHWVIVGGESGSRARPCALEWIWNIAQQCEAATVPCFVKQLGTRPTSDGFPYPLLFDQSHGGDMDDWPRNLRVRQFPEAA